MKRTRISRRTVLRGLMGGMAVAVGLPTLEAMLNSHGTAYADGSPIPVRLVTWFFGNGVIRNRWIPGGLVSPVTGQGYPLSPQLAPFANVREYVSVLTGFRNPSTKFMTHHEGMVVFSGYDFDETCQPGQECQGFFSNAGGPTIDQVAANHIGMQTPVPSIQIGISKRQSFADYGTTMHNLSHKSALEPLPPLRNPKDVFYTLFGSIKPPNDPDKPTRLAVLDAVRGNIKSLQNRLGSQDNQRLDSHLQGISELEAKINTLPPVCAFPEEPTETNEDDQSGNEPLESVNQVMSELLAYAFACDITRIASVLFHEGASDTYFPGLSGGAGHHNNSHGFSTEFNNGVYEEYDFGGLEQLHEGVVFSMTQLAYFLEKLKSTPDGVGKNLLDNTAMFVSSDCSEGWSHDVQRDQPALVIGGGGGRLVHPGIHFRHPSDRNLCDVTLTVLKAAVPEVASIGSGATSASAPVAEIMG